jgi:Na+/H+ antiporter NhaD/arsenite permease-like protein
MLLTSAVAIFLIAYILIASEKINRIAIVLCGAAVMLAIGASDFEKAFYSHDTGIDWNVIFLLLGMMIIVSIIHRTGLFEYLAIKAAQFSKGDPKKSLVYLAILTAVASAMLDNVTTILLAIPMTFVVCKKLSVTPVPFILVQVFASNIGGAATLIGDPPNIIIASKAGLSFNWFLTHMLPLVVVVLIVMLPVWVFMFRNSLVNSPADKAAIMKLDANQFLQNTKLLKKSLLVLTLVLIAFALHTVTHMEPAVIALFGAGVLVAISGLKPKDYLPEVEWSTLVFFMGLFIMVGALVNVGALAKFAEFLKDQFGGNLATASYSILGISAVLSGIVDNIPYVASMVPVVSDLNAAIGAANPNALWTALAFGADFGGNATIIGASANVVAIALAKRQGIEISFWQFAKYGIITTLISVALVYPYLALIYLSA